MKPSNFAGKIITANEIVFRLAHSTAIPATLELSSLVK